MPARKGGSYLVTGGKAELISGTGPAKAKIKKQKAIPEIKSLNDNPKQIQNAGVKK